MPEVADDVVAAPCGIVEEGLIHCRTHMHVGSGEVEGIRAQLGHSIAIHVYLILLSAIDAEFVAPSVGCNILAERYLLQHLVVAQCLVVHQRYRIRHDNLGDLRLID